MTDPHATGSRAAKGGMRYPDPGTEPHDFPDDTDATPDRAANPPGTVFKASDLLRTNHPGEAVPQITKITEETMTVERHIETPANLNGVLVRQLAALISRVNHAGHGTKEGAAIDTIQQLWDLGWDITPRLDSIGSKRERERRSSR